MLSFHPPLLVDGLWTKLSFPDELAGSGGPGMEFKLCLYLNSPKAILVVYSPVCSGRYNYDDYTSYLTYDTWLYSMLLWKTSVKMQYVGGVVSV